MPTSTSRLPTPLLIVFGLVNLPLSMLMSPTAAVLPNFYLDHSAVTLAGLATATFVARLFDGLTDPAIGYLSDRSGRRKPWMIAGAAVVAAGAWFLYNPAPDAGLGHLLVWYLAVTLGWTMVEIPHTAMAAELSRDYNADLDALQIPAAFAKEIKKVVFGGRRPEIDAQVCGSSSLRIWYTSVYSGLFV
jgi:Na+/melibiose symporter-like transporter